MPHQPHSRGRITVGRGNGALHQPDQTQHRGIDDDHGDPPCGVAAVAEGGEHSRHELLAVGEREKHEEDHPEYRAIAARGRYRFSHGFLLG